MLKGAVTPANREPRQTFSTAPHQRHRLYAVAEMTRKSSMSTKKSSRSTRLMRDLPILLNLTSGIRRTQETWAWWSITRKMIDSTKSSSHSHNNAGTHCDSGVGRPGTPASTTAGRDPRRGRASLHGSSIKRMPLFKKVKAQLADMYKELDD